MTQGLQMPTGYPASNPGATTPKDQYVNDLSSKYGLTNLNGNQTVYDKSNNTPFGSSADFFKSAGVNSFDGLKFDTGYKAPSPLDAARQTYLNSFSPSTDVSKARQGYLDSFNNTGLTDAKKAYNDFIGSEQSGLNRIADKTIPMTFITGQQASLRRNSEATANRLQDDVGLAQDASQIAQEKAKAGLDFANTDFTNSQNKAQAGLGFAQDDTQGTGANKLAGGFPFYKYPGSNQVFDAKTNQPLSFDQYKAAGGTGVSGQGAFGDVNEVSPTSSTSDKLLSVTEAKALGVPYGTTQAQAAALGIIPTTTKTPSTNPGTNPAIPGYPAPTLSGIKAIISTYPNEWGHAADAIDAKYGSGTATKYNDLLTVTYTKQPSTGITNPFVPH